MAKKATTKRPAAKKAAAPITITVPKLAKGEHWAGIVLDDKGAPAHHLILLPGDESANWAVATKWAEKQGGELPTRQEQSILFGNLPAQFQPRWYWSSEQSAGGSGCAWFQYFGDGYQVSDPKDGSLRARAGRRVTIQ